MARIQISRLVDAPVETVWAAWDDYGNIDLFNPSITSSELINGSRETGLGAERQCNIDDRNYIQERIVDYVPNQRMVVDIYNGTVPLKRAQASIEMRPEGQKTALTFTMEFTPKMGLIGRMMVPLMKSQFRKGLSKLIDGNKAYAERGETVRRTA